MHAPGGYVTAPWVDTGAARCERPEKELLRAPRSRGWHLVAKEVNAVALVAFLALVGITLWATGHLIVRW